MSHSQFESAPSASFSSVAEPLYFHNNLHYREVLATLRYGIIARKGLILLIGDAGVGKSTILHRLTRELDTEEVTWIFESDPDATDPDVNFTDLLRLILDNVDVPANSSTALSMIQRCKISLRAQLEHGRIVSLMIDNAEHLRDETLEYLLHYFYNPPPTERGENLLQIVLAGRPELREKLAQPRLRSLTPRSTLVCQLKPLQHKDIAAYLKTRLRAVGLSEETFDSAAVDRIAAYTHGNPDLINAISNRALQLGGRSPTTVTAEMVARAAHGVDLSEARRPVGQATKPHLEEPEEQDLEVPKEKEEPFRLVDSDTTGAVGQTFLNYTFDAPKRTLWPARRARNAARLLLIVLLLVGTAIWLESESGKAQLAKWLRTQSRSSGSQEKPPSPANPPVIAKQDVPDAPAPGGQSSSSSIRESTIESPPLPDAEKSVKMPSPMQADKATEETSPADDPRPARKASPPISNDLQPPLAQDARAQRKLLEAKIYKAIENRAINGVNVAVINGTVLLEGQVATERQKNAAERAARSVSGVDRVRNRIAVSPG